MALTVAANRLGIALQTASGVHRFRGNSCTTAQNKSRAVRVALWKQQPATAHGRAIVNRV
jgi:hypothetical protein